MARAANKIQKKTPRDFPQMRFGKRESKENAANLVKIGEYSHSVKNTNMIVIRLTENAVPYFNAGIYGEGNRKIADIDEIFGKFDDCVYASIVIDSKLDASVYNTESVFRADKFRCLSFDRVKGASQVAKEGKEVKKAKNVPQPFNRGRGSNFRTKLHNERVHKYAGSQISQNRRDGRDRKKREEFTRKTVEKRGSEVKMNKKITFTYDE